MTSIKDLYSAIKKVDLDGSGFEGTAYGLTYNDSLGLPGGSPLIVLSPFPSLPKDDDAFKKVGHDAGKMPIQEAFKAVLREGNKLATGQDILFIDFADLDQNDTSFFTEGGADSVADAIADLVNNQVPANVRPVIRFLRGTPDQVNDKFWNDRKANIEAIFYKDGAPRITHQKAELHVGFYSPNFKPTSRDEGIIKGLLTTGLNAAALVTGGTWTKQQIDALFDTVFHNFTFSASWNHGKIVAVGGKTMMTGGINYWQEYTSGRHSIIDMQAKVTGDAAVSAHVYVDYFFKYLNTAHSTDPRSFKVSTKLSGPASWKSDVVVPIFKDTVKYTPKTSGIQVLSVARIGDWAGKFFPAYPVQFIDALRDLFANVTAPGLVASGDFQGLLRLVKGASDTEGIMSVLRFFKNSPAAWASRTARVHAVANAQSTVYMSGQMIVGALQRGDEAYKGVVRTLNKGKPKEQLWDGYLWPYDLLLAFAIIIIRLRDGNAPSTSGIAIVLGNASGSSDWGDYRTVADITSRIVPLVRGLDRTLADEKAAKALVARYFRVRRIGRPYGDAGPNSIHTKTVCVDERLLYVGSDNLYPNYNEEHGIWVDEAASLGDWVDNYWRVLWERAEKETEDGADYVRVSDFPTDVV